MATNDFLEEWAAVATDSPSVNRKLFPELSLDTRVGRDPSGRPMVAVRTATRLVDPPQVAGIEVYSTSTDQEVNWLVIALDDQESIDEFAVLCQDLVDQIRVTVEPDEGLRNLLRCLERWKNLFLPRRDRLLSDRALRSLMSEVLAIVFLSKNRGSLEETVRAWIGPKGAPQDFQFEGDALAYEVKSVHRDHKFFTVSSIDQLDSRDYQIQILLVQLEDLAPDALGGIKLVDLIKRVLEALQASPIELSLFQSNLRELGFSLSRREYQHRTYAVDRVKTYRVDSDFPRLAWSDLPPAVLGAKYDLDSEAIGDFLVGDDEISVTEIMGVN